MLESQSQRRALRVKSAVLFGVILTHCRWNRQPGGPPATKRGRNYYNACCPPMRVFLNIGQENREIDVSGMLVVGVVGEEP